MTSHLRKGASGLYVCSRCGWFTGRLNRFELHKTRTRQCGSKSSDSQARSAKKKSNSQRGRDKKDEETKIMPYGEEDISYLTTECLSQLVKLHPKTAILQVFRLIYENAEHPENHNIVLKNRKFKQVLMYRNNQWRLERFDEIADNLLDMCWNLLNIHIIVNDIDSPVYFEFEKEMEDGVTKVRRELKSNIFLILQNEKIAKSGSLPVSS